jgi:hypothetical protein
VLFSGVIAPTAMDEYAFQEQLHNFKSYGYAMDRDGNSVGNLGQEDVRAQSSTWLHLLVLFGCDARG